MPQSRGYTDAPLTESQAKVAFRDAPLPDEPAFRNWYAKMAQSHNLSPNPDDPAQLYDYRAAFRANAAPDASGHWPSQFKRPGHPNEIVGGFNTRTGERVPGTKRANEAELIRMGWDAETAKRLAVIPEPSSQLEAPQAPSMLSRVADVGIGAIKGAGETAVGLGELTSKIPGVSQALNAAYGPEVVKGSFDWARSFLKPKNTAQSIGKGIEQTAEFFAPGGIVKRGAQAVKTGTKALDMASRLALEGGSAAAVDAAQKGTVEDALSTGALSAGTGAGVAAVAKGFQLPAKWASERIEAALLKPMTGALEGQTPKQLVQNMFKHKLGGTLDQSYAKVTLKLAEKSAELRSMLTADPNATVKLGVVANNTLNGYKNNPQAVQAMDAIREAVEFELNKRGVDLGNGVLNLADANAAKQAVGELGAWVRDPSGRVLDNSSKYIEDVSNAFYGQLKRAIESKATGDLARVNRELSELIPIKAAIIHRIPVEQRANLLKASDVASALGTVFEPSALAIGIGNRILGSGRAANVLNAASRPEITGAAAARLTGAAQ